MKASASQAPSEPPLPKLLVVSGETGHLGHGPSHNLLDEALASVREPSPVSSATPEQRGETGLWQDVVDELGLPTTFRLPDKEPEPSAQRGDLTREDKDALWALLAFIGVVWVVGSIVHKPPREKEHR